MMMNKYTKKNKAYNSEVIKALMKKHKVGKALVYFSITGERSSKKSELIKNDYLKLNQIITPIIENHRKEIDLIIEEFINAETADS